MKNLFRIAALILVLAQLFVISAAAGEVPASYVEQMKAAVNRRRCHRQRSKLQ